MRILAMETTEIVGSVAALVGERDAGARLVGDIRLPPEQRTAQSLVPAMRDLLRAVGWRTNDVELITLAVGPGSFTGLRAGVTAAKTFAYATGAEVLGVNTLEAIANQAPETLDAVQVGMDAQRRQVFAARYVRSADGDVWEADAEIRVVDQTAWLAELTPGEFATGPILTKLASRIPPGVQPTPPDTWSPQSTAVGRVGWRRYQAGRRDNFWRLVPLYLRKSAAEEKWEAKHGPQ